MKKQHIILITFAAILISILFFSVIISLYPSYRVSMFVHAAKEGDLNQVRAYLRAGIPADSRDEYETPLYAAASFGHAEVLKLLLTHGAQANQRDLYRDTPIIAAARMNADSVAVLLSYGANPNDQDDKGYTPLMTSCMIGDKKTAELLLSYSADVNLRNNENQTALMQLGQCTVRETSDATLIEMAKLLIKHGAHVSDTDSQGHTTTDFALDNDRKQLADWLESTHKLTHQK